MTGLLDWPKHEPLLLCDECRFYSATASEMHDHTTAVHRRGPSGDERTPLTPGQRADVMAAAKQL